MEFVNFDYNRTEVRSCASIGSDSGLVSIRRQAIIWSNDGLFYWRMYALLSRSELGIEPTVVAIWE